MLKEVFCDPGGKKKNDELPLIRIPTPGIEMGFAKSGPDKVRSATMLFPELAVPSSRFQKFVAGIVMSRVRSTVSS